MLVFLVKTLWSQSLQKNRKVSAKKLFTPNTLLPHPGIPARAGTKQKIKRKKKQLKTGS